MNYHKAIKTLIKKGEGFVAKINDEAISRLLNLEIFLEKFPLAYGVKDDNGTLKAYPFRFEADVQKTETMDSYQREDNTDYIHYLNLVDISDKGFDTSGEWGWYSYTSIYKKFEKMFNFGVDGFKHSSLENYMDIYRV